MQRPSHHGSVRLPFLVLARLCATAVFMTYPACLSALLTEWDMSATEGGIVQGAFSAGFAVSLLVTSYLCDRIGAKRVLRIASGAAGLASLVFALFARSFETGLIAVTLVGLSQGGTYTPAIMVVAANTDPARKNSAIGWILAGMSAGYVVSLLLSATMLRLYGYEIAFLATALVSVAGWGLAELAVRDARDTLASAATGAQAYTAPMRKRSRLLVLGYIGHSWELLGMWAWTPAFLTAAALSQDIPPGVELGIWTALALHLSGFFASFLSGYAADRLGVRAALVGFAALGFACSAVIGWLPGLSLPLLLAVVAVYGFATIGDSPVLSAAMTDAVPPRLLGKALGLRSVLGIGAGAVAPIAFGAALDAFEGALGWGIAFSTLALGGLLATACAAALRKPS